MENQMEKKMENEMETTIWGLGLRFRGLGVWVWGFLKLGAPFLGVPIIRTIVFRVYIGVPLFWETTTCVRDLLFSCGGFAPRTFM